MTGRNRSTRRKHCPSANLSVTYPTWACLGFNPRNRGECPATNRPKHGMAFMTSVCYSQNYLYMHDTLEMLSVYHAMTCRIVILLGIYYELERL